MRIFLTLLAAMIVSITIAGAEESQLILETPPDPDPARDYRVVTGIIKASNPMAQTLPPKDICTVYISDRLKGGQQVYVLGKYYCKPLYKDTDVKFYRILDGGKVYYIEPDALILSNEDLKTIDSIPTDLEGAYEERVKAYAKSEKRKQVSLLIEAVDKTNKQGVALLRNDIYRPAYKGTVGYKVAFINSSTRTIKYITFVMVGLNPVGDPVKAGKKGSVVTLKGVGPVNPNDPGVYEWDNVWFSDMVTSHQLREIRVEYTDGSKKTLKNINQITIPKQLAAALLPQD